MAEIRLPYQWAPRPYQQSVWKYLSAGGKRAVLKWPRRHGKDDVCLQHMACAMGERKGNYWYLLPEYAQARKSMWDAIDEERGQKRIDLIIPPAIRAVYREQEMLVGYGGSTLQFLGADNFHSLVGSPPVGIGFSEFARTNPSAWAYLMPILEKNRGFALFNSTPYGDNHFKTFCRFAEQQMRAGKDWFYSTLTADECQVYTKDQLQNIQLELRATHGEQYGDALFYQEYYTSFDAAIPGSVWGDCLDAAQRDGRIHPFAVDRNLPVYTGWDIGRTDDTAIWFYQMLGRELLIFEHHASSLKDIDFYVKILNDLQDQYGIRYATHYLPHDARPRTLAAGAGSMLQQMNEHTRRNPKLGRFAIAKKLDRQEGIQAARATFPFCRFHDTRTEEGRRSLRHYHRSWDEDTQCFSSDPEHDWASHDADAFRTLAVSWKAHATAQPEEALMDRLLASTPSRMTFGQLKQAHFRTKQRQRELAN